MTQIAIHALRDYNHAMTPAWREYASSPL